VSDKSTDKILLVDDDPNLLAGMSRQLRGKFTVATALSGPEGLLALRDQGHFAVVISDMRMPEMNGIQFLSEAAKLVPDTVRMMLTGNTDLETAMHALNEGNIFRFLVKPCNRATIEWALSDGIKQYRLVRAERELLEKTLKGSVKVLTSVLELVNPLAFSQTSRVRHYVRQVVQQLKLENMWQYELAAMLSQLGCVTVPADTLARLFAGAELPEEEAAMYRQHPKIGGQLLENIPRLEIVARMVAGQSLSLREHGVDAHELPTDIGVLGALILHAAADFDGWITRGSTHNQAVGHLHKGSSIHHPAIVEAFKQVEPIKVSSDVKLISVHRLNESMVLAEDVRTSQGLLVAAKGQQVTLSVATLLRNYVSRHEIGDEMRVYQAGATKVEESTRLVAAT
jgi:response regulator RpfG family c-di-GMP phosphodiesterase